MELISRAVCYIYLHVQIFITQSLKNIKNLTFLSLETDFKL